MKRYLFIFADTCEYICWPSHSSKGTTHIVDASFPKGSSDWEIIDAARLMEIDKQLRDHNCASENIFTRKLLRIVETAREVEL